MLLGRKGSETIHLDRSQARHFDQHLDCMRMLCVPRQERIKGDPIGKFEHDYGVIGG